VNFDFSDDQQAIKRTARELLADRFAPERVRELAEAALQGDPSGATLRGYDDQVWRELCELGWAGIFVGEEHGGQGLATVELTLLCEELGYALAPVPLLSNAAAGLVLEAAGSDEQRERWLPGIASGEARGTLGLAEGGEAELVPDAQSAEVLVLAEADGGTVVEASAAAVEPVETIDLTRRFGRVGAEGGEPLASDPSPGLDRARVALAGELVGVAQRALEMAVEYARERKQFGRPIGSYQAISHRCAQMFLEVESARSCAYYAAWAADAEPESLPLAAAMAKAFASDAGWRVTASALQVLGGIGFTWEHDLHFFLKRARVDGALYGSAREHRERVAELSGLSRAGAPA
jgi:alkylation response protein AidB-like acyl-CoA dehydrogenase